MAYNAGAVITQFKANMEGLAAGIKKGQKDISGFADRVKKTGRQVSDVGGTLTKFITGPLVGLGGAALGVAKKVANTGDELQKMSLRTGFSTESLSELKHAAELSGTSINSLEKGVKRMQKRMFEAERGMASALDSLSALGIEYEELEHLSPEEQFNTISSALTGVEDDSRRAALAQEIFGRAGTEMLPMLSQGEEGLKAMRQEAHELGIVFDQEAADAAAQFNDDLDRLKKGIMGGVQQIGMKLIPIFVDDIIPLLREEVVPLIVGMAERIAGLIGWFGNLNPALQKLILIFTGLAMAAGPVLFFVGKFISLLGTIIPLISSLAPLISVIAGLLSGPFLIAIAAAVGAVVALIAIWKKWGEEIVDFLALAGEKLTVFLEGIPRMIKEFTAKVQALWSGLLGLLSMDFNQFKELLKELLTAFTGWFLNKFRELVSGAVDWWQSLTEILPKMTSEFIELIKTKFIELINWLPEQIRDILRSIQVRWAEIIEFLQSIDLFEVGRDIMRGFIKGIKDLILRPVQLLKNMGDNMIRAVKNKFGVSSPSIVFKEIGLDLGEGLELGIKDKKKTIAELAGELSASVIETMYQVQVQPAMVNPVLASPGNASNYESSTQNIEVNNTYNVSDRATAEVANNDLLDKLRERGGGLI
ncbi:MAG: hypothetical protein ACOCZ3_00960 [Bacillota bacterium]